MPGQSFFFLLYFKKFKKWEDARTMGADRTARAEERATKVEKELERLGKEC